LEQGSSGQVPRAETWDLEFKDRPNLPPKRKISDIQTSWDEEDDEDVGLLVSDNNLEDPTSTRRSRLPYDTPPPPVPRI
jgi:hypothetical protein